VEVPKKLTVPEYTEVVKENAVAASSVDVTARKQKFWDKFKNNLIDLFKEEEDQVIK
jgi:cell division protein FtsA